MTLKKQYLLCITMMNVCIIGVGEKKQEDQKSSVGLKVNLLSFDIFSGGHIYKLSEARNGSLYTTLCIYMPHMDVDRKLYEPIKRLT